MIKELEKILKEYGFKAKQVTEVDTVRYGKVKTTALQVRTKNVDGHDTTWFTICPDIHGKEVFFTGGNTDCNNIWLYETRPDLKPEDIVQFFSKIKEITKEKTNLLKTYVDPEDWQEIANIPDASEDERYEKCALN